jgi:hypothetical protein
VHPIDPFHFTAQTGLPPLMPQLPSFSFFPELDHTTRFLFSSQISGMFHGVVIPTARFPRLLLPSFIASAASIPAALIDC